MSQETIRVQQKIHRKRGRPKGSGTLKKPEEKATKGVRITQQLWDFIYADMNAHETVSDTIFRMIRQANHKSIKLQKNVDALEQRLSFIQGSSILESKNRLLTFAN